MKCAVHLLRTISRQFIPLCRTHLFLCTADLPFFRYQQFNKLGGSKHAKEKNKTLISEYTIMDSFKEIWRYCIYFFSEKV